jgi:hypothetical protein
MMCIRSAVLLIVGVLSLTFAATSASAHTSAATFMSINAVSDSAVNATIDIDVRDLNHFLNLDSNNDAAITWAELTRASAAIETLVLSHTHLRTSSGICNVAGRDALALAEHGDGLYAHLSLRFTCVNADASLRVDDSGWFALDTNHRALLEFVDTDGSRVQAILSSTTPQWQMAERPLARMQHFLSEGIRHLITGYDHLAFLCVLLLALARRRPAEPPAPLVTVMRRAFVVITSFTIAHSCTLLLAATGRLVLPSRPVEVIIAASVAIAACLNLSRSAGKHGWKLAFAFGLVHGLGFAGALAELASERIDLMALAAFNVGIELAQVACAALAVPLIWWVFRNARSERVVLPLASLAVAGVAASWVVTRLGM